MVQGIPRQGGRRRERQAVPQSQDQEASQRGQVQRSATTRLFFDKVINALVLGIKIAAAVVALLMLVSIGSCTCRLIDWGRNAAQESAAKVDRLTKEFQDSLYDRSLRRQEKKEEEAEEKAAVEEKRKKGRAVHLSIRKWLSKNYAEGEGWESLNVKLLIADDTSKSSLVFPVIPYTGIHLPPIDLALAPVGTLLMLKDEESANSFRRDLWVVYRGKKRHTRSYRQGDVSVVENCVDTPYLSLESGHHPDKASGMESVCYMNVEYADLDAAEMDRNTRIVLEKVFWSDFDRSIRIINLPTVIADTPVHWDLVVRCYPAWVPDPDTGTGRWMPSPALDSEYLDLLPPSLHIKQTEDPREPVIWSDTEGLLSGGSFQTSSEEMIRKVQGWRSRNGYTDVDWKGGNQLHIVVNKFPDRTASEARPIGVTVRVILRVRTQDRG